MAVDDICRICQLKINLADVEDVKAKRLEQNSMFSVILRRACFLGLLTCLGCAAMASITNVFRGAKLVHIFFVELEFFGCLRRQKILPWKTKDFGLAGHSQGGISILSKETGGAPKEMQKAFFVTKILVVTSWSTAGSRTDEGCLGNGVHLAD